MAGSQSRLFLRGDWNEISKHRLAEISAAAPLAAALACVPDGSGCPRELRSRTRVQKAAQVAASPQKVSRAHPLPPATKATAASAR